MSLDYEGAGFGYYAGYACPGLPWVKDDDIIGIVKYKLPMVSQEIQIFNRSSGSIRVGFSSTAFVESHYLTVAASGSICLQIRTADLYISGAAGQPVEIFASLSVVDRGQMVNLSGSWGGI